MQKEGVPIRVSRLLGIQEAEQRRPPPARAT